MSSESNSKFPTVLEVEDLVDVGRRPYSFVHEVLGIKDSYSLRHLVPDAIKSVADAEKAGTLQPPLTIELGRLVLSAAEYIEQNTSLTTEESETAITLLHAVFEHGYNPANNQPSRSNAPPPPPRSSRIN